MKESLEKVTKMFESLKGKLEDMKLKANEKLKPLGKELTFKGFDKLNILAKLTIENLQNLQELSQWSVITCSSEFRAIVDELRPDPLFFFIMEMMNVPLSPKDTLKACNMASNFPSLSQSINPVVVDSDHAEETKTDTSKPYSNPYSTSYSTPYSNPYSTPYPEGTVDLQDPRINYSQTHFFNPTVSPPQQAHEATSGTP